MSFLIRELLQAGLLHEDVKTVWGAGLSGYTVEPKIDEAGVIAWREGATTSLDEKVLAPVSKAFQASGGLKVLEGNLGRSVIKVSAVKVDRHVIEAPARVFHTQDALLAAFKAGELTEDFIAVIRFQGPRANGMPELHKLTPTLAVLQDRGLRVALVTDGRMSGASGKVPAAIHVTPEAAAGGAIGKVRDGDMVRLDAVTGTLEVLVDPATFAARELAVADMTGNEFGLGRELFAMFRANAAPAELGAGIF
jgi:phosphogluconate dehydratase